MGRFCKNYFLIKVSKSGRNPPFFFFFFKNFFLKKFFFFGFFLFFFFFFFCIKFFCKSIRFFACVVYTFFSNMQVANRVASRL